MLFGLLFVSMIANLTSVVLRKLFCNRFEDKNEMFYFFNMTVSLFTAICILIMSGGIEISAFTFKMGILFGVITALQQFFNLKALNEGPYAYTGVIASLSSIIPAFSGYLIWNEEITKYQIFGIVLMVLCFICSADFKKEEKTTSKKWYFYIVILFFATGFIGIMQKIHQSSLYKGELNGFLVISFFISFLYSLFCYLRQSKPAGRNRMEIIKTDLTLNVWLIIFISAISIALNNKINLYLSGTMKSAIFFPIVNGGGLMLTAISSQIIFKEKLDAQKWLGIIIGIIAVVLLCI